MGLMIYCKYAFFIFLLYADIWQKVLYEFTLCKQVTFYSFLDLSSGLSLDEWGKYQMQGGGVYI